MENTITIKLTKRELEKVNNYAELTKCNISKLVKDALMEEIKDAYLYDKDMIKAIKKAEKGKSYSFEEARRLVGV